MLLLVIVTVSVLYLECASMCCCFTQFSPQLSQSNVLLLYSILSTAVSVAMFVLDDEFDEEDGAGLVCMTLSEGLLDGITATVALSTSGDTATSPSKNDKILWFMLYIYYSLFHR